MFCFRLVHRILLGIFWDDQRARPLGSSLVRQSLGVEVPKWKRSAKLLGIPSRWIAEHIQCFLHIGRFFVRTGKERAKLTRLRAAGSNRFRLSA
jgi:hypothetical protein